MVYKIFLLVLSSACLFVPLNQAQPLRAMTVDEVVTLGMEHNTRLRVVRAEMAEAQAVYQQARAARRTSLATQASYTRLSDNIPEITFSTELLPDAEDTFTLAPVELNRYYAELAVEQPLFTGFRLYNHVRATQYQANAASHTTTQEEVTIAFELRRAYWRLYQAHVVEASTAAGLAQVEAHLQDVENRRAAGAALTSDVLAAQTRRSEVQLARLDAAHARRLAQLALNRLAGLPLETRIEPLADDATYAPLPDASDGLVDQSLAARPALHALQAQVDALTADVAATQGAWFPEVALTGRYVYARPNQYFFTDQDAFKGTWEAGLALRWNLWDGGAKRATTQQAQARLEQAHTRLEAARTDVTIQVMQRYLEVQRAEQMMQVTEQQRETADATLRLLRQQYAEGAALSSDVLDAEQASRTAHAQQAQAQADYAIARAALRSALGQIW